MKFVKGIVVFLVLCLAAYGAFTLLKRSPQTNLTDKDIKYLQELGIYVQDGQAAESGLSAVLGDVDGVEPIGFGNVAPPNSTPPSFMSGQANSSFAPVVADSVPHFASPYPDQSAPEPLVPATDILPPQNLPKPVTPPVQGVPPADTPPCEKVHPVDPPPVLPTESPPPRQENWDGPASDLIRTPPPQEFLVPHTPPTPVAHTHRYTHFPVEENTNYSFNGGNVQRIDNNVRTIVLVSAYQEDTFSSSDSVPINSVPMPSNPATPVHPIPVHPVPVHPVPVHSTPVQPTPVHFVPVHPVLAYPTPVQSTPPSTPSTRQSLRFEPVKPESPPNTPSVAFTPPKRINQPQDSELITPQQPSPPATTSAAVKQIGTPRIIESHVESSYAIQPAIQEARVQFIQSQQQLAESGEPQNIRLAFIQLSKLYEHNQLGEAERAMMLPILDSLALTVIYARDIHILESPYRVKPGETVESIAQDFNLTPALLRKINDLSMQQALAAGTMLKVVEGQFDARLSLKRREMTLLLGGLYAGRVSFTLPHANIPMQRGEFYVTYRTDRAIALNNGWTLSTAQTRDATIVFSDQDARVIFDILSEQSVIVVE